MVRQRRKRWWSLPLFPGWPKNPLHTLIWRIIWERLLLFTALLTSSLKESSWWWSKERAAGENRGLGGTIDSASIDVFTMFRDDDPCSTLLKWVYFFHCRMDDDGGSMMIMKWSLWGRNSLTVVRWASVQKSFEWNSRRNYVVLKTT